MSGTKRISALTELASGSVAGEDIFPLVDMSQASVADKTKHVKVSSFFGAMNSDSKVKVSFKTVAAFVADNNSLVGYAGSGARFELAEGDIFEAGGYRYSVRATGASDNHVASAGGFKADVLATDGGYPIDAFGVDGTASAADYAAWNLAWRAMVADNVRLLGRSGATYYFDPYANGNLQIAPGNGQTVDIDFRGATIAYKAGMTTVGGHFRHLILVVMRSTVGVTDSVAKLVRIVNFVADGNLRNQTDPVLGTGTTEQATAVKVQVFGGADNNRLERVEITSFSQVDPIADTILVGPSTTDQYDLDGDGTADSTTIQNVYIGKAHAGVRTSQRAFIACGSQAQNVVIENITCDVRTGFENNSIETEYSNQGDTYNTITLRNVEIDDVEIGGVINKEAQLRLIMDNVVARNDIITVWCDIEASKCKLRKSRSNTHRYSRAVWNDCIFTHAIYDNSGTDTVRGFNFTWEAPNTYWYEKNCVHRLEGAATAGYGIAVPNTSAADVKNHRVVLDHVTFEGDWPQSVNGYAGGTLETYGCKFRCQSGTYAVGTGAFSTFGGSWYSHDDDFSDCTGFPFRLLVSATVSATNVRCRIVGGRWPSSNPLNYAVTGSYWREMLLAGDRRVTASALPTNGGGISGDKVYLTDAAYTSAASSDPISWECIYAGVGGSAPNAAVFRVMGSKP